MGEIRYAETADLAVVPERAFDYRLDFTHLPDYNPNVANLRRIDGGTEPGPGAQYLFDLSIEGMGTIESPIRVLEADRPERIVFETGPGFMAREVCMFTPAGGGTRAEFEVTLTIPGEIDDATRSSLETSGREQVRIELDLMKKILDS